jgi:L-lactate utilization protein LutC
VDDRDAILSALHEGTGNVRPSSNVAMRSVPKAALWECFVERLTALGGEVRPLEDLAEFRDRSFVDDDVPQAVRRALGSPVSDVWEAEAGVTLCQAAVAETGSLLIASGPGRSRLASLAPPVHIALVERRSVVASLEEGIALAPGRTSWLVTGPSRTADIEGVLVRGVHGPKSLWVALLPE